MLALLFGRLMTARRAAVGLAAGLSLGCAGSARDGATDAQRYIDDPAWRRAELVASLVNSSNGYSQLRLAHYASGDAGDWDRLPEWNPPVDVIAPAELEAPGGVVTTALSASATPLVVPNDVRSADDPRLIDLGRDAFRRYPVQFAPHWRVALTSRVAAARYGLWVDDERGAVEGLVRARTADGSGALMVTCSTCHAARMTGHISDGLPNAALDTGAAILDSAGGGVDPAIAAAVAAWGAGRLDVSSPNATEPARIPDLRPVRWLTYLQQDATVRVRSLITLAIRLETLIIVSHNEDTRPPRTVTLALAAYLASLAQSLPDMEACDTAEPVGSALFASTCARCHMAHGLTGEPALLASIGTDPTLGQSADRGTGSYRVPSLHGVGTRGPLLHDGTVPSVQAMFDPARTSPAFAGRLHGAGPVPGHPFGLGLGANDRAALVAYLACL
jgi:mono/diheme cytochrome c family protein